MSYPTRNTSTYTAPSKNSAGFSTPSFSGLNRLLIDDTYFLLIDADNRLLLEPSSQDWSYQAKS